MRIPGKARRTPVVHLDDKVSTLSASQEKTEEDLPMDLCFLPSKNTAEEEEEEEEEEEHIELQKGDHVQAQQDVYLWLLELRTHVQTLIDLSHRLPLPNEWEPSWTSMSAWTNTQVEVNALVQAFHQLLHRFLGPTLTSPSLLDPPTFSSSKSLLETLISHVQR
ncbi:hypothetical protein HMI56_005559 [Coelomomyces lativittatus]|nr:hypothetical protein HMI56_005559 [Coelomomyces lativittatus]